MFWSRSFIDERSFCQSFSRICLAMYQLCTTAAEHVGDASLWARVRASTLRRYVWVCAVHSVGLTPLMQSGTRVPKRLSHDSPIVWGWVACGQNAQWWDAVWHREENEERGKKICGRRWSDWNEITGEILPVLCVRSSLRSVIKENTSLQRVCVSLSQRNIYTEWVSADCQFTRCISRFIYLSFCTMKWRLSSLSVTQSSEDELKSNFFSTAAEVTENSECVFPPECIRGYNFIISLLPLLLVCSR